MITKLYAIYDTPFDHNVCHLFEHIVVRCFLLKLRDAGYSRSFFGWLNGQTIDSTVFFDLGAYDTEVVRIFENLTKNGLYFEELIITQTLAHIEAEMKSEIIVKDKELLLRQLYELVYLMQGKSSALMLPSDSPLKVIYRPRLFQEAALIINIRDIPLETQKAFLSFYPATLDLIRDASLDQEPAYVSGESPLIVDGHDIGIAQKVTIKKTVNLSEVEKSTQEYLQRYINTNYVKSIDAYRKFFLDNTANSVLPIRFYYQTNIKTTQEEMGALMTPGRLHEIFDHCIVRIELIKDALKEVEWTR